MIQDDVLVGQIIHIILNIASARKVTSFFANRAMSTFGLGFVPAPELRESALISRGRLELVKISYSSHAEDMT